MMIQHQNKLSHAYFWSLWIVRMETQKNENKLSKSKFWDPVNLWWFKTQKNHYLDKKVVPPKCPEKWICLQWCWGQLFYQHRKPLYPSNWMKESPEESLSQHWKGFLYCNCSLITPLNLWWHCFRYSVCWKGIRKFPFTPLGLVAQSAVVSNHLKFIVM